MERVILEVHHPGQMRPEYQSFASAAISVGRNFKNDVILSDLYVSPQHLVLRFGETGWLIEDMMSENGIFFKGKFQRNVVLPLGFGEEFRVGKTRLRLLSADFPVESTRLYKSDFDAVNRFDHPRVMVLSLVCLVLVWLTETFLRTYEQEPMGKLIGPMILVLFVTFSWAGLWAMIGRIVKHRNNFMQNLAIASFANILFLLWPHISEWIGYVFNSGLLLIVTAVLLCGWTFNLQLFAHLTASTNLSLQKRWIASWATAAVLVCFGLFITITFVDEFDPAPKIFGTLKPPFVKVLPSISIERMISNTDEVFKELAKDQ